NLLDIDGDGWVDVAVADASNKKVELFLNQGAGVFDPSAAGKGHLTFALDAVASATAVADIDGDGQADMAIAQEAANEISYAIGVNHLLPINAMTLPVPTGPSLLTIGDINGDGLPDLIVVSRTANTVAVFLQKHRELPTSPYFAPPADFSLQLPTLTVAM